MEEILVQINQADPIALAILGFMLLMVVYGVRSKLR